MVDKKSLMDIVDYCERQIHFITTTCKDELRFDADLRNELRDCHDVMRGALRDLARIGVVEGRNIAYYA